MDWSPNGPRLLTLPFQHARTPRLHVLGGLLRGKGGRRTGRSPESSIRNIRGEVFAGRQWRSLSVEASGGPEIYVLSIRDRQRTRISTDGGSNPVWGGDGRELFYLSARNEMMRALVDGVTPQGSPTVLFRPCAALNRPFTPVPSEIFYDVTRDGAALPGDLRPSGRHAVSGDGRPQLAEQAALISAVGTRFIVGKHDVASSDIVLLDSAK